MPIEMDLDSAIRRLASGLDLRFLLGVTGPPASGKSHLAERIVSSFGATTAQAVIAPMDGFHRSDQDLEQAGIAHLKGIPASFDVAGFVDTLQRIRDAPTDNHPWPAFDRLAEVTVPGAITIGPAHTLVVVEGNYLLVDEPPWDRVSGLLDEIWYLDVPDDLMNKRLLTRHARLGLAGAKAKIRSTDRPNAALIERTRARADIVVRPVPA